MSITEEVKNYKESDGPIHYLPPQGVINMQRQTKDSDGFRRSSSNQHQKELKQPIV